MPGERGYDGATRHTNNTAELTALLRAVQRELTLGDSAAVEFCVDSTYAAGVALGRWQPRARNRELARRLQVEYAKLRAARAGAVTVRHVRAHARVAGNEAVDRLAKLAAAGTHAGDGTDVVQEASAEYEKTRRDRQRGADRTMTPRF